MIVVGGSSSTLEVFFGDSRMKKLLNWHEGNYGSTLIMHHGKILVCGGYLKLKKCFQLEGDTWKEFSTLNEERQEHSAVTTQKATFLFGGRRSKNTYEYLPKDSTTWLMGKTEIPFGFWGGCAIAVKSNEEIWLIGGYGTERRILSFSVSDHTFNELPAQLNEKSYLHRCAFIPNTNKVMITGGGKGYLTSTEILDTTDGSVTMGSPLNKRRSYHGMGVVSTNGEDRLTVFGGFNGYDVDRVELYNNQTGLWEEMNLVLSKPWYGFGFQTVKLSTIIF